MQLLSLDLRSHGGIWAVIPCSTNTTNSKHRFFCCLFLQNEMGRFIHHLWVFLIQQFFHSRLLTWFFCSFIWKILDMTFDVSTFKSTQVSPVARSCCLDNDFFSDSTSSGRGKFLCIFDTESESGFSQKATVFECYSNNRLWKSYYFFMFLFSNMTSSLEVSNFRVKLDLGTGYKENHMFPEGGSESCSLLAL